MCVCVGVGGAIHVHTCALRCRHAEIMMCGVGSFVYDVAVCFSTVNFVVGV